MLSISKSNFNINNDDHKMGEKGRGGGVMRRNFAQLETLGKEHCTCLLNK
jgi:hypothetical protein